MLFPVPVCQNKVIGVTGASGEEIPFFTIREVNMVARFICTFPKLLPADGRGKDVQYVPFFEGSALDIAQSNTVQ